MGSALESGCRPVVDSSGGRSDESHRSSLSGRLRARLSQLEESQWWSAETMFARQLGCAHEVLRHASETVPFYRTHLDAAGVDIDRPLSPERWAKIPLLSRRRIQEAGTSLHSQAVRAHRKLIRTIVTSGSTGQPVVVLSTPHTRLQWYAITLRDHLWHGRDFRGKLAVIRYTSGNPALPPDGITRPGWGPATDGLVRTGPGVLLSVNSTIAQQARWLRAQDPTYLLTYPSNLEALASHFLETGETLPGLREIRTIGEVLSPHVRRTCLKAWNVPVVDVYTTQEVGYVALQCPGHGHYHVQSENLLVEVLDQEGRLCGPGRVGRVILTSLHNFATPLIRYDVGDYAEVGKPCPCGRGLPVLRRIMGRQRNMLVLPDGQKRWPGLGEAGDLAMLPPFRQYQMIQRTLNHIEVKLVAPLPFTPRQEAEARAYVQRMFGHPFRVTFTYVSEIPRGPGMKFEEFRSEVEAGARAR